MESESDDLEALLDMGFTFRSRPVPAAAATRPQLRVPLLLLILLKCRAAKLHWKGVQVLSWAVQSDSHMDTFATAMRGGHVPHMPIVRIEPMLDRAIDLAVGLGYVTFDSGRSVGLTALGRERGHEISRVPVFEAEKRRLSILTGKIAQSQIDLLLEWRSE